ncbi:DUF4397 domain-containing protein [Chitinophaga sp. XS-30]|uniref:DUF4397 domain-containing protein n=1 Tax=Chitinophaga sp. XS-30 TaxID=2604421 RepID=UPI0011DC8AB0|nr:DUF4397 domain-containing protein [Chitinophaga sp. XS-30]QEH43280.1 DUF4397 domain-containing protein [Chitinophaga sp. XS-30]
MRKLLCSFIVLTGIIGFVSCTREQVKPDGTASLTIVNGLIDTGYQSLMLTSNELTGLPQAAVPPILSKAVSGGGYEFGFLSGKRTVYLYAVRNDKLVSGLPLINLDVEFPGGYIGSLFIAGTLNKPDTLLVKDQPIYFPPADSSMGLRFVNLAQGSLPVSVNIKGQANGTEVNNLPFKGITAFKGYAANAATGSYVFEFRNSGTGDLLTSFTISNVNNPGTASPNLWRYRNFTLVLCGAPDSPLTPLAAFIVKNH